MVQKVPASQLQGIKLTCPLKGRDVAGNQGRGVCCYAGVQLEQLHKEAEHRGRNGCGLHDARDAAQAVAPEAAGSQHKRQARQRGQNRHDVGRTCSAAAK